MGSFMMRVRRCLNLGVGTLEKYNVKLMSRALHDIDKIYAYIAHSLLEPKIASSLITEIEEQIYSLEYMPYRCPERRYGVYANRGYRQLFVGNYVVIYRVDEHRKQVVIVTVKYSSSNF